MICNLILNLDWCPILLLPCPHPLESHRFVPTLSGLAAASDTVGKPCPSSGSPPSSQDHYRVYLNYHTYIRYGLNESIPLSWYTADPLYVSFKPVLSILSNAHVFVATPIAHLLAASMSHSFAAASTRFPKDSPPFSLVHTRCKSGQLRDSIQRLILFIKVARKHGGVVLGSNIPNLGIRLEYFKGVKDVRLERTPSKR